MDDEKGYNLCPVAKTRNKLQAEVTRLEEELVIQGKLRNDCYQEGMKAVKAIKADIAKLQAENESKSEHVQLLVRANDQSTKTILKLQAEIEQHRWIPVVERLPEEDGQVWICYEITGYTYRAHYDAEYKTWGIFDPYGGGNRCSTCERPTHWKPIILPKG